jgi:hypothetical protein
MRCGVPVAKVDVVDATPRLVRIAHRDLPSDVVDHVLQDVCAVCRRVDHRGCGKRGEGIVERRSGPELEG